MLGVWPLPSEQRLGLRAWGHSLTLAAQSQHPGVEVASLWLAKYEIALIDLIFPLLQERQIRYNSYG